MTYSLAVIAAGAEALLPELLRLPWGLAAIGMLVAWAATTVALERERSVATEQLEVEKERSSSGARPIRALIVGTGTVGQALARSLEEDGRYHVVGFVDDAERVAQTAAPLLGPRERTADLVQRYSIDEVFVAYAPTWQQLLAEDLATREPSVRVSVVPSPYEALMPMGKVESVGDVALVRLSQDAGRAREWIKRSFDLAFAVAALLVLAPLCAVVAVLIRLTSSGPAIFPQERIGRHGVPFVLYKFRTMVHNAESGTGPVLASGSSDSRLTPLGRILRNFRIDEIPQLWNVLRGEMSLVGPRPERPHFVERFAQMSPSYARRHQVRPGITGMAQVYAGYHTDARDKLRFDLIYVSHQSPWLDVKVLLRTVMVVIRPVR